MLAAGPWRFERPVHAQHRAIHASDPVRLHRPARSSAVDGALSPVVALIRPRQIDSHSDHKEPQQAAAYGMDARCAPTTQRQSWQHCYSRSRPIVGAAPRSPWRVRAPDDCSMPVLDVGRMDHQPDQMPLGVGGSTMQIAVSFTGTSNSA